MINLESNYSEPRFWKYTFGIFRYLAQNVFLREYYTLSLIESENDRHVSAKCHQVTFSKVEDLDSFFVIRPFWLSINAEVEIPSGALTVRHTFRIDIVHFLKWFCERVREEKKNGYFPEYTHQRAKEIRDELIAERSSKEFAHKLAFESLDFTSSYDTKFTVKYPQEKTFEITFFVDGLADHLKWFRKSKRAFFLSPSFEPEVLVRLVRVARFLAETDEGVRNMFETDEIQRLGIG